MDTLDQENLDFEEQDLSPTELALNNGVILQSLFSCLEVSNLKNVALVCQRWKTESRKALYKKCQVKFKARNNVKDFGFGEFCGFFGNEQKVNYKNFLLDGSNAFGTPGLIFRVLQACGRRMQSLELFKVTFVERPVIKEAILSLTPDLKNLSLVKCFFYDVKFDNFRSISDHMPIDDVPVQKNLRTFNMTFESRFQHLPFRWDDFFRVFPNIEDFGLSDMEPHEVLTPLKALHSFKKRNPMASQIKKLNIFQGKRPGYKIQDAVWTDLLNLSFNLEEFTLDIGCNWNEALVYAVIRANRNVKRLTLLRFWHTVATNEFEIDFTFPNMETFEMSQEMSENVSFTSRMPKLTSLILSIPKIQTTNHENTIVPQNNERIKMLQSLTNSNLLLTTLKIEYPVSAVFVNHLMNRFPNVKILQMHLTNEIFRMICDGPWVSVEELDVLGTSLNDEGITGIRIKQLNTTTIDDVSITRMTCIRKFTLFPDYFQPVAISDVSVIHGFLKLSSLKYIEIGNSMITQTGWNMLNRLKVKPFHHILF